MNVKDMFHYEPRDTIKQPTEKQETAGTWQGKVVDILYKSGVNRKNKKWTMYTIATEDNKAFTTFSSTDALLARCAMETGQEVEICWELDNWNGKSLQTIDAVKPEPAGPDEGDGPWPI